MVYVHTILRDVAGLFKVGRLVAYTNLKNATSTHMPDMDAADSRGRLGTMRFDFFPMLLDCECLQGVAFRMGNAKMPGNIDVADRLIANVVV